MKLMFDRRFRKRTNPSSIHLYFDTDRNIILIPALWRKDVPISVEVSCYEEMRYPYSDKQLKESVLSLWEKYAKFPLMTKSEHDSLIPAYEIITGKKRYSNFSKKYEMISITMPEEQVHIVLYKREKAHYVPTEFEKDISKEKIGAELIQIVNGFQS